MTFGISIKILADLLIRAVALVTIVPALASCAADRGHPGGLSGKLADQYLFVADSKTDQAYRAMVIIAMLTRIAERNTTLAGSAKNAVTQISGAVDTASRLYELADVRCYDGTVHKDAAERHGNVASIGDGQCPRNAYSVLFEAKIPDLEDHVYNLAAAAFPSEAFSDLLSATRRGNLLQILWAALWNIGVVVDSARTGFAVERASIEQRALTKAGLDPNEGIYFSKALRILEVAKAKGDGIGRDFDPTAFYAMFSLIRESCYRIRTRISVEDAKNYSCPSLFYGQKKSDDSGLNPR